MVKVLVTGGTGLIGRHLSKKLEERGYEVRILSRKKAHQNPTTFFWNPDSEELDIKALEEVDYIIHLAGAGVADKKWTNSRKKVIIDSRVKTAQIILRAIKEQDHLPKAFITASGVGYYGTTTSSRVFEENDLAATDFLGETCRKWEQAADEYKLLGIRTVKLRTGIVLSPNGGALEKMSKPIKFGFGSALGKGDQFMPWIHIDDLCNIYIKAIEDEKMNEAYNAVAPEGINNTEFTKSVAQTLKRSLWLPNAPAMVLKIIFGEMSSILLKGSRVSPKKIIENGFQYQFPKLSLALKDVLN